MQRTVFRTVLSLGLMLLVPLPSGARGWESRGIGGGGGLFSVTISPHDPDHATMATDMGAVFETNDFGASWETVPFSTLKGGVDTHVRFTSSPEILYATHIGMWDERIPVRSDDGGATFAPLDVDPTDGEAFMLHADRGDTERVLVAAWNRLYFSSDGGASFSLVLDVSGDGNGMHLAGVLWDGQTILVGTNHGMLISEDGGSSFAIDSTGGIPGDEAMVAFTGAREGDQIRLFAVTYDRNNVWGGIVGSEVLDNSPRVYRLNWGDSSWSLVRDDIDGHRAFFAAMAVDEIDVAYLAGTNTDLGAPSVMKTTDGGDTWVPIFLTQNNENIATGWVGSGGDLEWYWPELALGFGVAPHDPDHVIITDFGFVHLTTDGGVSWRQAYVDPAYENPAGAPTPPGRAYATSGVEQTSAWWLHWASPDVILAAFTDIRGIRSTDGGVTWTSGTALGLPHNTTYHIVEHPETGTLYAGTSTVHDLYQSTYLRDSRIDGGDGHLIRSLDGGATWQLVHDFNHPVIWLAFDPDDSERLYASVVHSTEGGIFVTENLSGAADFARLSNPPRTEGHPFNIRVLEDGTIVTSWSGRIDAGGAFTESSGILVSTDGGASWEDRSDPNMTRWTKDVVIDSHDPTESRWYVTVFSHWGHYPNEVGGIYRTTNRGLDWTRISDLYRVESITIDPTDPDIAYIGTEVEGLWRSENLRDPLPLFLWDETYPFAHPVRTFYDPHHPGEIWSVSFGGGLHLLREDSAGVGDPSSTDQRVLLGNSPNPFRASTNVVFLVPRRTAARLTVFDLTGRTIATLVDRVVSAGRHRVAWDGRDRTGRPSASGPYYYKLETVEGVETGMMMLVR